MELVDHIFPHPFWATCGDPVTARSGLKRVGHDEAVDTASAP